MARWWMLVAMSLLGWTLAQPAPVHAQPPSFAQDPAPSCAPEFLPPDGAGECPPWNAWHWGTPKVKNAWDETCRDNGYLPIKTTSSLSVLGWARNGLGNGLIALAEPDNAAVVLPNPDTGVLGANTTTAMQFRNAPTQYNLGMRAGIVTLFEDQGCELTGFYQPRYGRTGQIVAPGQLAVPFFAFPPPFGFTGTNFLWLQDDVVEIGVTTQLFGGEINYRYQSAHYLQWICGVRYIDCRESFRIRVDDDVLAATLRVRGVDVLRQATYTTEAYNRMVGPQIGIDIDKPIAAWLDIGFIAKYMLGFNFYEVNSDLVRGDNFRGPSGGRSEMIISHAAEVGLSANVSLNQYIRVNFGYNGLFLVGIPVAHQQVNFNPSGGPLNRNSGSIFFHGPELRFEVRF